MMAISLGLVIYAIQALKSPSFQKQAADPSSALSILIGAEHRPFNWCPKAVRRVDVLDSEGVVAASFSSAADLSAVCEVMMGAAPADEVDKLEFKKLLVASASEAAKPVILEKTVEKAIFRVHGMPFTSQNLEKVLNRKQVAD